MDTKKAIFDRSCRWTNERHLHFLNTVEASFVRTMLENNGGHLPRMDRYLPDSADSTLDLKTERRRRHSASDILDPRMRTDKRASRRLSHQPYTSIQDDQVVPQIESGRRDEELKDQNSPMIPITQATSAD